MDTFEREQFLNLSRQFTRLSEQFASLDHKVSEQFAAFDHTVLEQYAVLDRRVAVIESNYATKADVIGAKNSIIMWVVSAVLFAQVIPTLLKAVTG